jgi:CHAT domain-containing protein
VGMARNDNSFHGFLARLWSDCVRLVLEELGFYKNSSSQELPRIWWIGTGLASSLPFHAAGDHSIESTENTLSWAISSYTPTIKALRHAREKTRAGIDKHSILLVTMPKTPGKDDLPGVKAEKRAIYEAVQNPHSIQLLDRPSKDTVLDKLRDFSIVHFACHGSSDLMNPSNSFLALQGNSDSVPEKLTVQEILDANLGRAWLAYLSACSTAQNKVSELADEDLHLASSFQVAGFGHVIASMWPSNDAICAQVASIFYRDLMTRSYIKGDNRAVAAALHAAVKEIRLQNIERPYLWAQYIHSGA